jgi:hypothetical protein
MATLNLIPVTHPQERKVFLELPWKVYRSDPNWIPPLKKEVAKLLDTKAHPFWQFAEQKLFLVQRGGETVGRIAGIIDHNYNRFHDERMGIWGFFECTNDVEAAAALMGAVEEWLREKGMAFVRGPLNPSTNYEGGLLVEGYEQRPVFMMTYNPPYYSDLIGSCGFKKEKDLLAFWVDRSWQPPPWVERLARRTMNKVDIQIRPMRVKEFKTELQHVKDIYHEAWFDNWGFVPLTDAEWDDIGHNLTRLIDPGLSFFMVDGQEPIGVAVVVPDINPLLKRFNGKIGMIGWLKYLLYRHEINGLRGLIFGIKNKYRQLGLPLLAFDYLFRNIIEKPQYKQYKYIELGWNLEDNDLINQWYVDGGAKVNKRFRIYRKELTP